MRRICLAIIGLFSLFILLQLVCCTSPPVDPTKAVPEAAPPPGPTKPMAPELPGMKKEWAVAMIQNLTDQYPALNKGEADMAKRFCPGYGKMTPEQRIVAWGYLASAVISHESGCVNAAGNTANCYTTGAIFKQCSSMTESNGVDSIGFFQLSYGDSYCPKKKSEGNLCDPGVNIKCGVKLMAKFVAMDGVVAGGGYVAAGNPPAKGLARYWSVIRLPDDHPRVVKYPDGSKKTVLRSHDLSDIIVKTSKAPGCY